MIFEWVVLRETKPYNIDCTLCLYSACSFFIDLLIQNMVT